MSVIEHLQYLSYHADILRQIPDFLISFHAHSTMISNCQADLDVVQTWTIYTCT